MSDVIVRGNSIDGGIRIFTAVTTELAERARVIHGCSPLAAAALGRALTIGAIMGAELKNDTDKLTIQFNGDGPLGRLVVLSNSKSEVRGYADNPGADLPLNKKGKIDVGGGIGKGTLGVIKDLGLKEPYIGRVPIVTGEIGDDLIYYYASSEQIPTAIGLGVLVDTDMSVRCAGGFMLQLMPEAGEETAERLEKIIRELPPVTSMLDGGMTAEDMLFRVTDGFSMTAANKTVKPVYRCDCSRERMERALVSLGEKELSDIIEEQGSAELTCQFCDNKYEFSENELRELIKRTKRK